MSIRVALRHRTKYIYDRAVKIYPQVIRLKPAPHTRTSIVSYSLKIEPNNHFINWQQDPFGNYNARVVFPDLVKEFCVDVEVIADLVAFNPFDFFLEESAETFPFEYDAQLKKELTPYLEIKDHSPEILNLKEKASEYLNDLSVNFLVNLNQLVNRSVNYVIRFEPGVQTCQETLQKSSGSCRDSAWLLVQLFRHYGLAARFASGYLVQLKADEEMVDGPSGTEVDFTDLHAWAEVFIPGAGWIGLDATSGLFAGEGHIPLACTPDPGSAAPITGNTGLATSTMEYSNIVERIYEKPRVTLPYSDEQLDNINKLGDQVDKVLVKNDVRLTMGGEPTFVSSSDMESDQWNEGADGDDKRKLSFDLLLNLKKEFAKNGLIHIGQGKWYPGEAIPRWQYAMYWRKDGDIIWANEELLANPNTEGSVLKKESTSFASKLVKYLGIGTEAIHKAYEDPFYYLWEEQNLPTNIDLKEIDNKDSIARRTLAKIMSGNLGDLTGIVIPLEWNHDESKWVSCVWEMRRKDLILIPGNSDLGYRLPLDRLPKKVKRASEIVVPPDTMEVSKDLISREEAILHIKERSTLKTSNPSFDEIKTITTALCLSIKNGHLAVFLPPFKTIEPFLELVTILELVATELNVSILLEGYQAPFDQRIEKLVVAPDPGVIEVNVHPSKTWKQITNVYTTLFEAARLNKLGAQKFMLDGKHTGTGGGNHITLGGAIPKDSPLLRNPALLESMLRFWVNHPGLSYLFSSAFVGMTSQAPRLDEGKPDAIYNLEIAFKELNKFEGDTPYYLVDRLFRNILTDITGNTHRAEFCIDKMYSPDSSTGRLGILELRGFDMPPHRDMCLVQLLLIRSIVAVLWQYPYKAKLIKWGSILHDKFMLHQFVKQDMEEVVYHLNKHGINFNIRWLDPFLEFRFPILGTLQLDEIKLTLRSAIEPWNVLGEEMSASGTARFVDSSMERLEVQLENFNSDRYRLLCNQQVVPLTATGVHQQFVSGIRYKAWAPPSALHPTKSIDTPLTFDVYDTWNNRTIGGCTYHVMHPGGRNYDTFPVNAFEAEGRRVTRFTEENHSPSEVSMVVDQSNSGLEERYIRPILESKLIKDPIIPPKNEEYPFTLDLQLMK